MEAELPQSELLKEASIHTLGTAAGGHADSIICMDEYPGCVLKPLCAVEAEALHSMQVTALKDFCPEFHGKCTVNGSEFIVIKNLVHGMTDPMVMDIKIGTRTFEAAEAAKPERRMDLLSKMQSADPSEATDEEKQLGITKLRYMLFREQQSSSAALGFRIEGVGCSDPKLSVSKEVSRVLRDGPAVEQVLGSFLQGRTDVMRCLLLRLGQLQEALEGCAWFPGHEMVGSSLLLVYDRAVPPSPPLEAAEGRPPAPTAGDVGPVGCGVWMIDFAHTYEAARPLTHRSPWEAGSQEDGYLTGLDNLVSMLGQVLQKALQV